MEFEKIETIYKMLINGLNLNDNTLRVYGFSKEEVQELLSRRILEQNKDKTYKLVVVEKFRKYGVTLLSQGKEQEAKACFDVCYELAPTGKNICLQAILQAVKQEDYNKVFEIFPNLEKNHPEKNANSNDLYLYLLSIITSVPEEYIERTRQLEPKSLILPYTVGTKVENEIRKAIAQNKFTYACQLINERMLKEKDYSVKFELLRALVIEAIEWNKSFKRQIAYLIQNEKYEDIVSILMKEQEKRHLSELETNILLVAYAIINIQKSKNIPPKSIAYTNNMQEAILGNNFELALKLNEEFLEANQINKDKNAIHILLAKLNSIISSIKETQSQHEKEKNLTDIEELAYYISSLGTTLESAAKQIGLLHEQVLLIKLIYVRDYYVESNYEDGDTLLQEVEGDFRKTPAVTTLLEEIKVNRDNYKEQYDNHKRKLSPDNK